MRIPELEFVFAVLLTLVSSVFSYLPTYFMDEWCSTTLDMSVRGIEGGRMLLRPPERGMRYLSCFVFFKAPQGKRLSFRFRAFDIQSPFDCNQDHLQIFDDKMMLNPLTGKMCNSGLTPSGVFTTEGEEGTLRLFKRNYLNDQIEVIFTSFHGSPCREGEFQCANSHCIAQDLYCNGYDNCGDESDMCILTGPQVAGVVIAAIIVIIIIAVVVAYFVYRRQQRRRMEKLYMHHEVIVHDAQGRPFVLQEDHVHYVDAWMDKKSASDSRSTLSSRLDKSFLPSPHHNDEKSLPPFMRSVADNSMYEDMYTKKPLDSSVHSHNDTLPHKSLDIYANSAFPKKSNKPSSFRTEKKNGGPRVASFGSADKSPSKQKIESFGSFDKPDGPLRVSSFAPADKKKQAKPSRMSSFGASDKPEGSRVSSFRSGDKKNGGGVGSRISFGPSTSPSLKKSKSEGSVKDVYSVPKKGKKRWGLKRKTSSMKYLNAPDVYRQDFNGITDPDDEDNQMFERNPSFREGMKGEGESRIPIHSLDPASLPGADQHLQSPDTYDHVISFRSYPSPQQGRKEKVVYLYPGHPGYNRLYQHTSQEDATQCDPASLHSSRSSLVKL